MAFEQRLKEIMQLSLYHNYLKTIIFILLKIILN